MLAVITRPMVIATDAGTSKQFMPKKDGNGEDDPQEMSEAEFGRLRRAGAAARFIVIDRDMADAITKEITDSPEFKDILASSEVAKSADGSSLHGVGSTGLDGVRNGIPGSEEPSGPGSATQETFQDGADVTSPVSGVLKPKSGRKAK